MRRETGLLTHSDLYVIAVGRVFQVVDGAHHVQSHVTDVVGVELGLLRGPGYHHISITNGLNLKWTHRGMPS